MQDGRSTLSSRCHVVTLSRRPWAVSRALGRAAGVRAADCPPLEPGLLRELEVEVSVSVSGWHSLLLLLHRSLVWSFSLAAARVPSPASRWRDGGAGAPAAYVRRRQSG